jgi:hypothetical protein
MEFWYSSFENLGAWSHIEGMCHKLGASMGKSRIEFIVMARSWKISFLNVGLGVGHIDKPVMVYFTDFHSPPYHPDNPLSTRAPKVFQDVSEPGCDAAVQPPLGPLHLQVLNPLLPSFPPSHPGHPPPHHGPRPFLRFLRLLPHVRPLSDHLPPLPLFRHHWLTEANLAQPPP